MTHYTYKVMQDILKSLKLKKIKTFNIAKKTLIIINNKCKRKS